MDKKLKSKILKGSASTSIGTISGMIFQFFTIMILTRYVTKDDLGIYVLVLVIVNMFTLLGGLGVGLTMVKFIASKKKEENRNILLPVLLIRAFGSLLFSLFFLLTAKHILHFFDDRILQYGWYIIVIFILANYRDLFYQLMQGLNQFRQYSIVNVVSSVFRLFIVVLFLLFSNLDIRLLLIIEILSTVQPLIHQLLVIPFKKYLHIKPSWETYKKIIKFSFPLYLNNLVVFINGRMNIFIIGAYLNPASIANYDIARKMPTAFNKIYGSFIIVYFPNLAALFSEENKKPAVNLIEKSVGLYSISMVFVVLFIFFFRNELTVLLYSELYADVSLAFALLMLNFFIAGLRSLISYAFTPAGYPSVPVRINAFGSVISIGFSFLFIPIYGYMGAVYSLLIMNTALTFLTYRYSVKYKINPKIKLFLKPIFLFFIAPLSLLFNEQNSLLLNSLMFIIALILGWIISNEFRSIVELVISYAKRFGIRHNS
ncbi:MAG TPA: oligosaccharide flippase family protein [Ignavibacteriaceae bacterium]|nr:oligosaccharide flippase family protein [Ignavibacteriaceae bacterium]